MSRILFTLLLTLASAVASAYSVTINQAVGGTDNLYYTDWGHWYTVWDNDHAIGNPASVAASAVSLGGSAFNFSGFDTLSVSASGIVVDRGVTATGPDGCAPSCGSEDSIFRLLPVYSLIGIWSSSATEILPFGDWTNTSSGLGLLEIGSLADLTVPDFASAYLFLAENDGYFDDNSGHYDVTIVASVPEPAPLALLAVGLFAIVMMRRRSA